VATRRGLRSPDDVSEPVALSSIAVRPFPAGLARSPSRPVVAVTATAWWLAQPPMVWIYYHAQLRRHAYPHDADAIMIPIAQMTILWAIATPLVGAALVAALLRYHPGQTYTAFDSARRLPSALWSVLMGIAALLIVNWAYYDVQDGYPLLALAQVPGLLVVAWVRSSLCAPHDRAARAVVEPAV
jgi:hypothetical protein